LPLIPLHLALKHGRDRLCKTVSDHLPFTAGFRTF
jgi:hypothetical protein